MEYTQNDEQSAGPLAGVRVVDFSENLPGPFASLMLHQLGAEVIKIEKPGGDPGRRHPLFPFLTAGKRSVELDLKAAEGVALARELIELADVVIEGFRPGVAARLGIGFSDASTINHSLVYCSLSGYGQHGTATARAGHDLNYLAAGGLLFENRDLNGAQIMAPPPGHVADYTAGLLAAVAILGHLQPRDERRAVHLDLALADAAALPTLASIAHVVGGLKESVGARAYPHYRLYETADNRHIALGITPFEQSFWDTLARALELNDLIGLDERQRKRDGEAIAEALSDVFSTRSLAEWREVLDDVDVPWSAVLRPDEVVDAMRIADRPVVNVDSLSLDFLHTGRAGAVPALGEANDHVRLLAGAQ